MNSNHKQEYVGGDYSRDKRCDCQTLPCAHRGWTIVGTLYPMTTAGDEKRIVFDSFCLDLANERLWKGSQAIKLRPKVFALLDYLLGRPGLLVTKEELIEAVWP